MLEASGDKASVAHLLNNMGAIYESLGQNAKALESYQQALQYAKQIGDNAGETTALKSIERLSGQPQAQ